MPTISGEFEVTMQAEPPYDTRDGVTLGRASFDKTFRGPLEAKGAVQMLAARSPIPTSAAYVAIERIEGSIEGRKGSFVVTHVGTAEGDANTLAVTVVPDTGTGELAGLRGQMRIRIEDGKHFYELEYSLP